MNMRLLLADGKNLKLNLTMLYKPFLTLFSILFFHLLRALAKPGEPVNGQDERRFQRRR